MFMNLLGLLSLLQPAALATEPTWEVGVGAVNSLEEGDWIRYVDGLRALGRRVDGAWAVEAQVYVAPDVDRYNDLDTTVLRLLEEIDQRYGIPVTQDRASATLLGEWRGPAAAGSRVTGGFRLYGGAELRYQVLRLLISTEEDSDGKVDQTTLSGAANNRLTVGAVAGVGWQLELERASARFVLTDRISVPAERFPAVDGVTAIAEYERLHHAPTVGVDVLYRF